MQDSQPAGRPRRHFLAPDDLAVTDAGPRRLIFIGRCFALDMADALKRLGYTDLHVDRLAFMNTVQLPADPPQPAETYDLQIIQVPLSFILPGGGIGPFLDKDENALEDLLADCASRLELALRNMLVYSNRIPAFVMNFLTPQQNLLGRLMPRYELRNPIHFIERLNMELDRLLKAHRGAYLLDANHIASTFGRRFVQEDAFWPQFHGGFANAFADNRMDSTRIEPPAPVAEVLGLAVDEFVETLWLEIRAAFRTLKRADEVKMVCVDIDHTLWRGVMGETTKDIPAADLFYHFAGWPLGLTEVLQYLKRRGIILAIISKNDDAHVRALWKTVFGNYLHLDEFAIQKINWKPKPENIAEAIAEANVLPKSVVFLDDNPVERAAVKAAFPDIRVLETSHYRWARVLGWSPELQVAQISEESARRTEMIQAKVERQQTRAALTREDFLASLDLKIAVHAVRDPADARFARAFELINKTNQFNTTGVRWSDSQAIDYLAKGGVWWTVDVTDRFTRHGLVMVICLHDARVDQFVMSCRVAGLDAEIAAFSSVLQQAAAAGTVFSGTITMTENNITVRDIFQRIGWTGRDGNWEGPALAMMPPHIVLQENV